VSTDSAARRLSKLKPLKALGMDGESRVLLGRADEQRKRRWMMLPIPIKSVRFSDHPVRLLHLTWRRSYA
jgi:hypothetical protein